MLESSAVAISGILQLGERGEEEEIRGVTLVRGGKSSGDVGCLTWHFFDFGDSLVRDGETGRLLFLPLLLGGEVLGVFF